MSSHKKPDYTEIVRKRLSTVESEEKTNTNPIPLGDQSQIGTGDTMLYEIPMELIVVEEQIRKKYNDETIEELAKSIEKQGLIQPIEVKREGNKFRIIAGFRRYFAHKKLGKKVIKAIVKIGLDDQDIIVRQLVENIQRENLTPLDEANAIAKIIKLRKISQQQLAELVGKSKYYVSEMIGIDKLAERVVNSQLLEDLKKDTLVQISRLPEELINEALKKIRDENLGILESRKLISQLKEGKLIDLDKIKRRKELMDFCNQIVTNIKGAADGVLKLKIRYSQDLTREVTQKLYSDVEREIANLKRSINAVVGDDVNIQVDLKIEKSITRQFPVSNTIVTIGDSLVKVGFSFFDYTLSKTEVIQKIKDKIPNIQNEILEETPIETIIDQWNALPFQKIEKNVDGFYFKALKNKFTLPARYIELKEISMKEKMEEKSGKWDRFSFKKK